MKLKIIQKTDRTNWNSQKERKKMTHNKSKIYFHWFGDFRRAKLILLQNGSLKIKTIKIKPKINTRPN